MLFFQAAGNPMSKPILALVLVLTAVATAQPQDPFESGEPFATANDIDTLMMPLWEQRGIQPANRCSDQVFMRRAYLDVIGTLPRPQEVQAFLKDTSPDKRAALIDTLLEREEFADYWALKWCDLLRVKAEFPINLWPKRRPGLSPAGCAPLSARTSPTTPSSASC